MVTMHNTGITITVPENEVDRFKRAGYSVVDAPAAADPTGETPVISPVELSAEEVDKPAAADPKPGKSK